MKKKIHLIDDESIIHDIFKKIFQETEYNLIISENLNQAVANHRPDVDVTILDQMIPGTSGFEIFKILKEKDPTIQAIFLTAYGTIEAAIEAIKMGAVDYLQKPFNNIELKHRIDRIINERRLNRENLILKQNLKDRFSFNNIIGNSSALKKVLDIIKSVADSNTTILITGESGTGKELVAKAIHTNSNRFNKPFFAFNSSNIPANLFESLLFGYKKGAYTGAYNDKKGLFEEADGGTIFFDEIANLDFNTQAKILRVLQEKEIQPLGSNKVIKVDVRIIAATNISLKEKVKSAEFREDLYYRLNVVNIHLPPLRERMEDIPLLVEHFIKKFSRDNHKPVKKYDSGFLKALLEYNWPGNIRELENAIQRAVLLSSKEVLTAENLPDEIRYKVQGGDLAEIDFFSQVNQFKRKLIIKALEENNWIQRRAAQSLMLNPSTFTELVKKLGIKIGKN